MQQTTRAGHTHSGVFWQKVTYQMGDEGWASFVIPTVPAHVNRGRQCGQVTRPPLLGTYDEWSGECFSSWCHERECESPAPFDVDHWATDSLFGGHHHARLVVSSRHDQSAGRCLWFVIMQRGTVIHHLISLPPRRFRSREGKGRVLYTHGHNS